MQSKIRAFRKHVVKTARFSPVHSWKGQLWQFALKSCSYVNRRWFHSFVRCCFFNIVKSNLKDWPHRWLAASPRLPRELSGRRPAGRWLPGRGGDGGGRRPAQSIPDLRPVPTSDVSRPSALLHLRSSAALQLHRATPSLRLPPHQEPIQS